MAIQFLLFTTQRKKHKKNVAKNQHLIIRKNLIVKSNSFWAYQIKKIFFYLSGFSLLSFYSIAQIPFNKKDKRFNPLRKNPYVNFKYFKINSAFVLTLVPSSTYMMFLSTPNKLSHPAFTNISLALSLLAISEFINALNLFIAK